MVIYFLSLFSLGAHTRGREVAVSRPAGDLSGSWSSSPPTRDGADHRGRRLRAPCSWADPGRPGWHCGCGASSRWPTNGCASSRRRRPGARSRRSGHHRPGAARRGGARHLGHRAAVARCAPDARSRRRSRCAAPWTRSSTPTPRRSATCVASSRSCGTPRVTRPPAPQPSLSRLDDLLEDVRGSGPPGRGQHGRGQPRAVPPGVDLSAYRIIQEALTNVLKHAGTCDRPSRADLRRGRPDPAVSADDGPRARRRPTEPRARTARHPRARCRRRRRGRGRPLPRTAVSRSGRDFPTRSTHERQVRVVLADDQPLVRAGLRMILETEPDIEIVGEAANGAEVVGGLRAQRPDVVLMDVRMPVMDGIEATRLVTAAAEPRRACWCSPPSTSTRSSTTPCGPERAASCSRTPPRSGSPPRSAWWPTAARCSPRASPGG